MSAGDTPVNSPEIRRLARVIEPGHNYATVTDKIASIVLTRPTSIGWLAGFDAAAVLGIFSGASTNTPSLGAGTQTLSMLPGIAPDRLDGRRVARCR